MILQRLAEHYDRIAASEDEECQLARPGFSKQKISFSIVLEWDGSLNLIKPEAERESGRRIARSMLVPGQAKPSGQGLNPGFLWDNAAYMLGWSADYDKRARAALCFESFRDKHLAIESRISHPAFTAVCSFLRDWSPDKAMEIAADLQEVATNFGVFRIAGEMQYIHELIEPPVLAEATEDDSGLAGASGSRSEKGLCLVMGIHAQIARLHEPKIKGVAGAQSSGALLVSFNAASYESYGKSQSYNAPVSEDAAFRYTNALNCLLNRRDRRVSLGDSTVVFWADHASVLEDCLSALFSDSQPKADAVVKEDQERLRQAKVLLTQLRDGIREELIDTHDGQQTKFFLLGLSPNASRISVRLWVEAESAELQQRLGQHLRDIALVGGRNDEILTLQRIVRASGRAEHDAKGKVKGYNTENVSPKLAGDLARSVLTGAAYPQSLLATMLRRIHSDGEVAYARVAAIKACLLRNSRLRGNPLEVSIMLDPNSTDPAYCCGRAFALLEVIQIDSAKKKKDEADEADSKKVKDKDDKRGLNKTIKDSYFSSASVTPGLIFPRLFRLSQHHLAKLETGDRIHREKQLGEVLNKLSTTPGAASPVFLRLLSLEDQGKFVLGYFHQTKDIYTSKKDKEEGADH
jgi:CRISPR-associated protein Csd1